jgi:hypothetical protein
MHTKKAASQHTTVQELAKLTFHEAGDISLPLALSEDEGFQVSSDGRIEGALFRAPGTIRATRCHVAAVSNPTGNAAYLFSQ